MKKIFLILPLLLFLAAGCSSKKQDTTTQQPVQQTPLITDTAQQDQSTKSSFHPSDVNSKTLKITEWGVEFTKPSGLEDLTYSYDDVVYFSSDTINKSDPSCSTDPDPTGSLNRTNDLSSLKDEPAYIQEAAKVKINNYYYWYQNPEAICTQDPKTQELISNQIQKLKDNNILKTLKAIK